MKRLNLLLILMMFLLSSCSSGSLFGQSTSSGTAVEDKSGYGLEVEFNIDDRDIQIGRVEYSLTLKNSGKLSLIIKKEDFILQTASQLEGEGVFTKNSIESFKKKLFRDKGEIILRNNQKIEISGLLEISSPFKETLYKNFDYTLEINYNYKTEFNNNIKLIIARDKKPQFEVIDSISQAAPIQVTDIQFKSDVNDGDYILEYTIEDKGKKGDLVISNLRSSKTKINIENMDIIFGTSSIYGGCVPWYKKGSEFLEAVEGGLYIDESKGKLVLFCRYSIANTQGILNTKTSGFMEYKYKYSKKGTLRFPEKKNSP